MEERQPMTPTEATLRFIAGHRHDDVRALALQADRYPDVDMREALTQIAGRQTAETKVPTWAAAEGILYPPRIALEQCSSEEAARYKATLAAEGSAPHGSLADLTGGFGIDFAFLAPHFAQATYVERQEALCAAASHNFPLLGLASARVVHADCTDYLKRMEPVDLIYLDPARRDGHGGKTVAIGDCEPDAAALEPLLLEKAGRVMVKLSPMLDLTQALHALGHVAAAHVVAVAGECKELLLVLAEGEVPQADDVPVRCVNLAADDEAFTFTRREEQEAPCRYADRPRAYLYEPNASLLKAGAFRHLSYIYKVEKLHASSHLYTSDILLPRFPGRRFRVEGWCGFGRREVQELLGGVRKANLTVRNFPATVAELRKRFKLSEGGAVYLFATTLNDGRKALLRCGRV